MKNFKSHLLFNKQQRAGILLLVIVIVALLSTYLFVSFSEEPIIDISSAEVKAVQAQIDSLRKAEIERRKPKLYPFNPNFITDFKAYALGMTPEEFDRLKHFRSKDQWINSVDDFKRVTRVSDSLLDVISPYFKFPDWVKNAKPKKEFTSDTYSERSFDQKIDLNKATENQLQEISGIGEALSKRIVVYRDKLGGFAGDVQLYEVWGLDPLVVQRALQIFTVKTPKPIRKINVNTASASDIATIPGISFELAKRIWEYRVLHEGITDFSALEKIDGMSAHKLALIQLYLSIK